VARQRRRLVAQRQVVKSWVPSATAQRKRADTAKTPPRDMTFRKYPIVIVCDPSFVS
jgi:hypothetical protein